MMIDIAKYLASSGWTLRSGGARGADTAFEAGAISNNGKKHIYLPQSPFNNHRVGGDNFLLTPDEKRLARNELSFDILTHFDKMKPFAKNAHARNYFQIHGRKPEKKSQMIIYWCEEDGMGQPTGGTRTAVLLAREAGIPDFNLKHKAVALEVLKRCKLPWKAIYEEE